MKGKEQQVNVYIIIICFQCLWFCCDVTPAVRTVFHVLGCMLFLMNCICFFRVRVKKENVPVQKAEGKLSNGSLWPSSSRSSSLTIPQSQHFGLKTFIQTEDITISERFYSDRRYKDGKGTAKTGICIQGRSGGKCQLCAPVIRRRSHAVFKGNVNFAHP